MSETCILRAILALPPTTPLDALSVSLALSLSLLTLLAYRSHNLGGGLDEAVREDRDDVDMGAVLLQQKLQMLAACMRWRGAAGVSHCGSRHDPAAVAAQQAKVEAEELR